QQVVARHAAEGLQDLVPNVLGHPLEVFVRREIHEVAGDLLESRLDRGRVEFEAEGRATRRATGRIREPGRPARRAPPPGHRLLRTPQSIRRTPSRMSRRPPGRDEGSYCSEDRPASRT